MGAATVNVGAKGRLTAEGAFQQSLGGEASCRRKEGRHVAEA